MNKLIPGIALAGALALSACGGGGGSANTGGSGAGGGKPVSVAQLSGAGRVLIDDTGKALYTPDQEANGKIVCSGGCTAFWKPVPAAGGKAPAGTGTGKLGVIKRPDGTMQLTANGKPLYTFSQDSPRKVTGDGFTDDFSGRHFTWHVVRAGGETSNAAGTKNSGGGGGAYDSSGGSGSGGNYGY